MTDQQVKETRDDLEMMRRPHLWPGLKLFLKRGRGPLQELAMLGCDEDSDDPIGVVWVFVPESEPFKPDFSRKETGGDEMLVRLCQEGWMVD
jgi:hypothetical protein